MNETIVAISTPVGKSGIGIVRLSGKDALSIADKVFVSSNGLRPSQFPSHTLHYGWIADIDEVLLTVMRAPRTYTREDIVEINCHSGITVLRRTLELVLKSGARLAQPGEFTKRAFLNGRIDLAQAEAVLDVINSQTTQALQTALGQLQGGLSQHIKTLRKNILDILTQLELSIDFSDQDIEFVSPQELLRKIEKISRSLKKLLDSADRGTILREGVSCVICGRTNVGKSSLLNALLKKDRAIVTPIPGTTRDTLEETVDLCGVPLRLIDTAGIIRTQNLAEKEAVKRSQRCLKEANFVFLVLDASCRLTSEDWAIAQNIADKPAFLILNKQDLPARITPEEAKKVLPERQAFSVSALCGTGLDRLEKALADSIWQGKVGSDGEILVSNIRHREALRKAHKFIQQAIKVVKQGQGAEIIALKIQEAQRCLGQIIGEIGCEDVLDQIFSQFCIGK